MVMGNEVLHNHSPAYPAPGANEGVPVRVREHTVTRVLDTLSKNKTQPPKTSLNIDKLNATDVFCGYLLLDVLVSNQDRHHENWAIISDTANGTHYLAPSYDHAASLGRELTDAEREERLHSKDKNRIVETFVSKARSELFHLKTNKKPLSTLEAFNKATEFCPKARSIWLDRLQSTTETEINDIVNRVPPAVMSNLAKSFAIKMIIANKQRILSYAK